MTTFLAKLRCGNEELELWETSTFAPAGGQAYQDEGEFVRLSLHMKGSTEDDNQALLRILHQINWYNQQALRYTTGRIKEPVYLGVKVYDGNEYDTVFGRGWQWKRLYGLNMEDMAAIRMEMGGGWTASMGVARVRTLDLSFRAAPVMGVSGEKIYTWETLQDRWVGTGMGAIRPDDDGGVLLEIPITNKIPNSDFENEADRDNGWSVSNASLTRTENTTRDEFIYAGFASIILSENGTADRYYSVSVNVGNTNKHSLMCVAKCLDGKAVDATICQLYYNAALTTTYEALGDGWYLLKAENFNGINAGTNCGILVKQDKEVAVDCFDLQESARLTTHVYGNMGYGYTFSGTSHTSTSVRAAAALVYRNDESTAPRAIPESKGTMLFVVETWQASADCPLNAYLLYTTTKELLWEQANQRFGFTDGFQWARTGAITFAKGDVLFVFAQWGPSGLGVYVYDSDGVLLGSGTYATYNSNDITYFLIGSDTGVGGPGYEWNAPIYEVQSWGENLTQAQMQERVKCGWGSGELPFINGVTENIIYNRDGTDNSVSYNNWFDANNVPGDFPAACKLLFKNEIEAATIRYFYLTQMKRALPRTDLASKRGLVGIHWTPTIIQVEDGSAYYDGDTTSQTLAGAMGAAANNTARVAPSATTNVLRVKVPIVNEPEDLWKYAGTWRVVLRYYTSVENHFRVQFAITTAKHTGPFTPQFYLKGGSIWLATENEHQVVNIPSHFIDPQELQTIRPGDWSSAADGPYCYLEIWVQADAPSGYLYLDALWLMAQDAEGYGVIAENTHWVNYDWLCIDSISRAHGAAIVDDYQHERFFASLDWWGSFFLPVLQPSRFSIMWRRHSTGYPWTKTDYMSVFAKYRPRYERVR